MLVTRGLIALHNKHYAQASELFTRALELDQADAKALSGKGKLQALENKWDAAFQTLLKALRLDLSQTQALVDLVELSFRLSRYNEVVELLRDYIQEAIGDLSAREQKILEMRFGLTDGVTHTLEEVGKEFDVTRERIRQIEAKALEKMQGFGIIEKLRDY